MRQRLPEDHTRDHIDVVHFFPGQPPSVEEVSNTPSAQELHWWSPIRASGLLNRGYSGGDFLITLDDHARVIEERNVPYMQTGVVLPGGDWLAYATRDQIPADAPADVTPDTIYLLNLHTGRRLQVTPAGMGVAVQHASPDGRWFLIDALIDGQVTGVLVSADGQQQVRLQFSAGHDTRGESWSPDGRYLAYSVQGSEADQQRPQDAFASRVYVVDVAARTATHIDSPVAMLPSWAPDSTQLAVLAFDPTCAPYPCSGTSPAYYLTHR
jgi:hypothetical protein